MDPFAASPPRQQPSVALERFERLVRTSQLKPLVMETIDVPKALTAADDATLAGWDYMLTETIQGLGRLRRRIRDERQRHTS